LVRRHARWLAARAAHAAGRCGGEPRFRAHLARQRRAAQGVAAEWGTAIEPKRAASTFYGGDLPGLTARLPYLQDELGVTALHLNPVFASRSNHRYDTTD